MFVTERIISLLAPHDCLGCGVEGAILCQACSQAELLPVAPRCYRCKSLSRDFAVCAKCRRQTALKNVWICSEYDGLAKDLARALKFGRVRSAATVMAQQMADLLPLLPKDLVFIPVPTATSRVRQRGYDQASLIAKELARIAQRPYVSALRREGQSRQVGAGRQIRLKQLDGAFYAVSTNRFTGRPVCLVDDISTTGATIQIAAQVLRRAGAKSVSTVVFAQKV